MLLFLGSHSSIRAVVFLWILFNILMLLMPKVFLSEELYKQKMVVVRLLF